MDDVDDKDIILASEIFKSMTKTLKTFKTYLPNNPVYQKFAAELFEKFKSFFDVNDSLSLTVEQFSLLFNGKEVFHSEERADNIALMLFADGIRELSFNKGITVDELISFLEVFKAVSEKQNLEDDVVTLLWEKNMEHIGYSVSEGFIEEALPLDNGLLMEEAGDERTPLGATYANIVLAPSTLDFKVVPASNDELNILHRELQELEGDGLLSEAAELFLELMTTEKDIEGFKELARNVGKIIDTVVAKNDIEKASEIIGRLRTILDTESAFEHKEIIDDVIDGAGSEDNIRKLFIGDKNFGSAQAYLLLLNKNAIPPLLNLLGECGDRKGRRDLCNILSAIGKQAIDAFEKGIYDDRWYLVRNTLMILGIIKEPAAIKYIEGALHHPELRVRKEAVRALESIGSHEVRNPLMTALKDKDPGVRTNALRALRKFTDKELFEFIKERILAGDLKERPFTEKRELFEALAETDKDAAFPILSDFFRKRGLFRRTETEELRACAAYGLGVLNTRESIALVEKGTHEREGLVSDVCKKTLARAGGK
ncbi:MAG: HEAT repeat domain-containing protein [Nitrospirae bacterium]|nr:MAG: HEAT repeat domain-containing protein [Nitrospirota bacterium]